MEALMLAAAFFAVLFVVGLIAFRIEESTGHSVGDWVGWLVYLVFLSSIALGGMALVAWGIDINNPIPIVIGVLLFGMGAYALKDAIKEGPGGS